MAAADTSTHDVATIEAMADAPARPTMIANGATRFGARVDGAVAAGDAAGLGALFVDGAEIFDHKTGRKFGREERLSNVRALLLAAREPASRHETLAVLGRSLALLRRTLSASGFGGESPRAGAYRFEELCVVDADLDGRCNRSDLFAVDSLGDAIACLYERHAEQIPDRRPRARAPPQSRARSPRCSARPTPTRSATCSHWTSTTPITGCSDGDPRAAWSRSGARFARCAARCPRSRSRPSSSSRCAPTHSSCAARSWAHSTTASITIAGDPSCSGGSTRTAASRTGSSSTTISAITRWHVSTSSPRRLRGPRSSRPLRRGHSIASTTRRVAPLATSSRRAGSDWCGSGPPSREATTAARRATRKSLLVIEVDVRGDPVATVRFDPADREAASSELDARYAAGEAREHPAMFKMLADVRRALSTGDWDRLSQLVSPDLVAQDHRPFGWGTVRSPQEYAAAIRQISELRPDVTLRFDHPLLADRAALFVVSWIGSDAGRAFEIPLVVVFGAEVDGRIQRAHHYNREQIDDARARFAELA